MNNLRPSGCRNCIYGEWICSSIPVFPGIGSYYRRVNIQGIAVSTLQFNCSALINRFKRKAFTAEFWDERIQGIPCSSYQYGADICD